MFSFLFSLFFFFQENINEGNDLFSELIDAGVDKNQLIEATGIIEINTLSPNKIQHEMQTKDTEIITKQKTEDLEISKLEALNLLLEKQRREQEKFNESATRREILQRDEIEKVKNFFSLT